MSEIPPDALDVTKTWIKNITAYTKPLKEIPQPPQVVKEIVASSNAAKGLISSFKVTGVITNPALVFDSASTIETLSAKAAPISSGTVHEALTKISLETAKAKTQIKAVVDQKNATEHILDYYKALSDSVLITRGLKEIGIAIKENKNAKSRGNKIKGWVEEIIDKIKSIGTRLKAVIADFDKALLDAINDLKNHLGRTLSDIVAKFRALVAKFHEFALYLIRKMFDFVGEVQEIAEEKKFTMKEITMEVPSYDVEVLIIAGVPIPIPKIQTPKLTISFRPKGTA